MPKLTKQQATQHQHAVDLLALDRELREDEKRFVLEHWQESATSRNPLDGAYFTPLGLARDLSIEVSGPRILDLGAGIGHLAFACRDLTSHLNGLPPRELVCVERNPRYVEVGSKVLPEATWICADLFELPTDLGRFDTIIANPPYGATARSGSAPHYRGRRCEYHVIDIASRYARNGVFLIPQQSAPFTYSGQQQFRDVRDAEYQRFAVATGIHLESGCGADTSIYRDHWRGVRPVTEIVTADFADPVDRCHCWPGSHRCDDCGDISSN